MSGVDTRPQTRRAYIDVARGLAVLLMIEAHTVDAWTRVSAKHGPAFRDATILGGFAAPLFLWLAGVAVVLAATRAEVKLGSRAAAIDSICRRGFEIFILAFLFRLQAFIVSPGSHPVTLFRVDILNVMGPAIALAGLAWGAARSNAARVWVFAVAAAAVAMITPIVRAAAWIDLLPTWLQWHFRPAGEFTTFTLFPWTGFVLAGGATGALVASARVEAAETRVHVWHAVAGAGLVAIGFITAARPSIYAVSSFWTSSPTWFAIRLGAMMLALGVLFAALRSPYLARRTSGLARFGRSSLFVYWIHVELVYGYASWLWRGRLPLWGTAIAWALFSFAMYRAIDLRDAIVARMRRYREPDFQLTTT